MSRKQESYDPFLLSILAEAVQIKTEIKIVSVADLEKGMTIDEDIFSYQGEIIVVKGTRVSPLILTFLNDYSCNDGVRQPFRVVVSREKVKISSIWNTRNNLIL